MADTLTKEKRSWNMSRITSKNTKPEMYIRSLLHRSGYRFRLHCKDLEGKPDIVLTKYKTVIFIHGCFWHHHNGCYRATTPKSKTEYWINKFERNILRFKKASDKLLENGWKVLVIWECIVSSKNKLSREDILKEIEIFLHSDDKFIGNIEP